MTAPLMIVHPGASYSTHDVHVGLVEGLKAHDVKVWEWRLDGRVNLAHNYLHYLWRQKLKTQRDFERPNQADVLYQATTGLIERAIERGIRDLVIVTAMYLQPNRIELAKRAGIRVWLLCTESPYMMDDELRLAALCNGVWTNERAAVPAFQAVQPNTAYLPHAYRLGVHDRVPDPSLSVPSADVLFVGSMFDERIAFLNAIDWSGIDLHLYTNRQNLPRRSGLRRFLKGDVQPNELVQRLAQRSKIVLNLFRQASAPAESLNPRCYEMAAAGVCMVSDDRAELGQVLPMVPTFTSPESCERVLRGLLADDGLRQRIAANARAAILPQTWHARTEQIMRDLTQWSESMDMQRRSA
mgnify:FL=1|jgi:hypothetical protein